MEVGAVKQAFNNEVYKLELRNRDLILLAYFSHDVMKLGRSVSVCMVGTLFTFYLHGIFETP